MNTWIVLAWRNLFRHTTRSLLTGLLISISGAVLVFFISLQFSSYQSAINATVLLFTGHIQLQHPDYFKKAQIEKSFALSEEIEQQIKGAPGVVAAGRHGIGFALMASHDRSYGVQLLGVEPAIEPRLSSVPGRIISGQFFGTAPVTENSQARANPPEVVLGSVLARRLRAAAGSEVTILGQGKDGSLAASVLRISGIFESGSDQLDAGVAMLRLNDFQEIFALGEEVHSLVVRLDPKVNPKHVQAALRKLSGTAGLEYYRWDELLPGLQEAIELDVASGWVFYLSLIVVTAFSAFNTFLMTVLERTREFAVMLALGTSPYGIAAMILLEALLLSVLSLLSGMLLGSLIVYYFGVAGFAIPGTEEMLKHWNLPSRIYPYVTLSSLTLGPSVVLLSVLVAAIYPSLKVLRINPAKSLGERR